MAYFKAQPDGRSVAIGFLHFHKRAFVHYPTGTYPGQDKALADNTHFNPYGAYQIARCVVEGMKQAGLPFVDHLREDVQPFRPSVPDG